MARHAIGRCLCFSSPFAGCGHASLAPECRALGTGPRERSIQSRDWWLSGVKPLPVFGRGRLSLRRRSSPPVRSRLCSCSRRRRHTDASFLAAQDGRTPLLFASLKGHEAVVSLLLAAGAGYDLADTVRTPSVVSAGARASCGRSLRAMSEVSAPGLARVIALAWEVVVPLFSPHRAGVGLCVFCVQHTFVLWHPATCKDGNQRERRAKCAACNAGA
jgi:hypothetical protein